MVLIFYTIILRFGMYKKIYCLDSTSMQVYGEYEDSKGLAPFRYSKDHYSNLNFFLFYLMTSKDRNILFLQKIVKEN
ncbi:hypothetical protein RSOCI_03850 [Rhabdochlamydiaceae symbiont of Dictyostelium giganteum]